MMGKIQERIELINSFKFLRQSSHKESSIRIRNSNISGALSLILAVFCISLIIFAIIIDFAGVQFGPEWEKSSLLVICCISIVHGLSNDIYKRVLLKHLQFIEDSTNEIRDASSNDDLAIMISDLNRLGRNVYTVVLAVLLLLGALANSLGDNPYWEYFKIPALMLFIVMGTDVLKNYRKLRSNIIQAENQLQKPFLST